MDVTRESSPLIAATAIAKPLDKPVRPVLADELDGPPTQPILARLGPVSTRRPPRIDPVLRERPAFAAPGWLALLVVLAGAVTIALVLVRTGVLPYSRLLPGFGIPGGPAYLPLAPDPAVLTMSMAGLLVLTVLAGLVVNPGGQSRVLTRWGRYRGTIRRTGLMWVNPLLRRRRVAVRLRHWRSDPVEVTDRTGTPLVVRLLVVWRVRDTARAVIGVADHEEYLREQVHAVLTRTAGTAPCDSAADAGPVLRDSQWFSDELTRALAAETAPVGIEVYSVQPLAIEYAPDIADSMRRRRLAELDAGLRTALVDDAMEAAVLAVRRLERATAQQLDEVARRSLMERLLVAFVTPAGMTAASVPLPGIRAPRAARR